MSVHEVFVRHEAMIVKNDALVLEMRWKKRREMEGNTMGKARYVKEQQNMRLAFDFKWEAKKAVVVIKVFEFSDDFMCSIHSTWLIDGSTDKRIARL